MMDMDRIINIYQVDVTVRENERALFYWLSPYKEHNIWIRETGEFS